jgi:hypothetical protein
MLSLVLAMLVQAVPAAPEDEIVVVGRKLAAISATVTRGPDGKLGCALSESSGHASLDAQLCRAASQCVRKGAADAASVKACIDGRKPDLLAAFRQSWGKRP